MRYTVLSGHFGMHGSLMNLLDLTDYLVRLGHDVDFVCLNKFHLKDKMKQTMRSYKIKRIFDINSLNVERVGISQYQYINKQKLSNGNIIRWAGTIITDFKTLISWPTKIICNKLVILDNAELSYHLNDIIINFYPKNISDIRKVLKKHIYNDCIFCMPPSNFDKFKQKYPDLNSQIFFKKINIRALYTAKVNNNGKFFYRGDNPPTGLLELAPMPVPLDDLTQMFNYSGYVYYRRQDRADYEQLGRMIFEFIIFNKRVYFYDQPTSKPDGLNDYWNHYGKGDRDTIIEMMLEHYKDAPWE